MVFSQRREGAKFCFTRLFSRNLVISTERRNLREKLYKDWLIAAELLAEISPFSRNDKNEVTLRLRDFARFNYNLLSFAKATSKLSKLGSTFEIIPSLLIMKCVGKEFSCNELFMYSFISGITE